MESRNLWKNITDSLINILFPIKCLGCQKNEEILCDICISKIDLTERETMEEITAVFDYRNPLIKKAIWEMKYNHRKYIGKRLGELLFEFLLEDISEIKTNTPGRPIMVIPVPISYKKTRLRGYNQAFEIAYSFCSKGKTDLFELRNDIVIKTKETIPQAKIIERGKRIKNIIGVFKIEHPEKVKGRTIIIIDDVTTTGGTISEIIKILKIAGAKRVIGFAVAH